jgi:YesN/AraC family two-component response regulator
MPLQDPSRFDLVITGQAMPEMTGFKLAKEILALRANMLLKKQKRGGMT